MSCQRTNIHSVASTTQVELNANANNLQFDIDILPDSNIKDQNIAMI